MIKFFNNPINDINNYPIYYLDIIYIDHKLSSTYYCYVDGIVPSIVLYDKEEYFPDITSSMGEQKLINIIGNNPQLWYDNYAKNNQAISPRSLYIDENKYGPGTILHNTLSKLGFETTPLCKCKRRMSIMNIMGPSWCAANIDTILGWLREESEARNLVFVSSLAKILINRAIKKSQKYYE